MKKNIQIVCLDCGRKHKTKEKEVMGVWIDDCDICGKKNIPCANALHDFGIHNKVV